MCHPCDVMHATEKKLECTACWHDLTRTRTRQCCTKCCEYTSRATLERVVEKFMSKENLSAVPTKCFVFQQGHRESYIHQYTPANVQTGCMIQHSILVFFHLTFVMKLQLAK